MVRKVVVLTLIALLSMVAVAFAEANPQVAAAGLNVSAWSSAVVQMAQPVRLGP